MVFSADDGWDPPRQALAVEPMTAPPDAFRSGRDLVTLAPAGAAGRRGVSLLGDPDARVTRAAVRARSIRSWRTATVARSPSADWIARAWRLVPSARSRIANGAPGGRCTASTSAQS